MSEMIAETDTHYCLISRLLFGAGQERQRRKPQKVHQFSRDFYHCRQPFVLTSRLSTVIKKELHPAKQGTRQAMHVWPNTGLRSRNHRYRGKEISITYSKCVTVGLSVQHAKRMRRIIRSSVAGLATSYFSTLSHKRHDFRGGKNIEHKMYVWFSLQILSKIFFILRIIHRVMLINVYTSSCKVTVILVGF